MTFIKTDKISQGVKSQKLLGIKIARSLVQHRWATGTPGHGAMRLNSGPAASRPAVPIGPGIAFHGGDVIWRCKEESGEKGQGLGPPAFSTQGFCLSVQQGQSS